MWFLLEILIWLDLGLLVMAYLGYPAGLWILARVRPRKLSMTGPLPEIVHLVISLHDEEKVLEKKISNSLNLNGSPMLILADDGSSDGSEEICRTAAADSSDRVRYVRVQRGGKNRALNEALESIPRGVVVFTDANAMFAADAVQRILEPFSDPAVGCVVGQVRFRDGGQTMEGTYWRYEDAVKRNESAVGSMVVGNGAIIAARRELVPELLPAAANDLQIPLAVARAGFRTVFQTEAKAYERVSDNHREEHERKVRMAIRGLSNGAEFMALAPGWLKLQFFLHKVMRWLTGLALLEILALSVALALGRGGLYCWLLGAQAVFYGAAALGMSSARIRASIPGLSFSTYFVVMHLAGLQATWAVLRGRRVETWDSPSSTRVGSDDEDEALQ